MKKPLEVAQEYFGYHANTLTGETLIRSDRAEAFRLIEAAILNYGVGAMLDHERLINVVRRILSPEQAEPAVGERPQFTETIAEITARVEKAVRDGVLAEERKKWEAEHNGSLVAQGSRHAKILAEIADEHAAELTSAVNDRVRAVRSQIEFTANGWRALCTDLHSVRAESLSVALTFSSLQLSDSPTAEELAAARRMCVECGREHATAAADWFDNHTAVRDTWVAIYRAGLGPR